MLLDGTPAAATGWDADFQAALPIGMAVPVSGGDFSVVVQSVSAAGAVVTVTPTAPAGGVAVAPAAPVEAAPGEVMSGTGAAPSVAASPGAAPPVGGAAPIALQAPGFDGRALGTTHALESVADSSTDSGFLVPAAAVLLLSAATLLLVRRLRAGRLRVALTRSPPRRRSGSGRSAPMKEPVPSVLEFLRAPFPLVARPLDGCARRSSRSPSSRAAVGRRRIRRRGGRVDRGHRRR